MSDSGWARNQDHELKRAGGGQDVKTFAAHRTAVRGAMRAWNLGIAGIVAMILLTGCGWSGGGHAGGTAPDRAVAGGGIGGTGDGGDGGGGGGGGGVPPAGGGGTTTLQISLAGRQAPWMDALDVTFEGIDLHVAGGGEDEETESEDEGWVEVDNTAQAYDVLQLTDGQEVTLYDGAVTDSAFDKIRVRVSGAAVSVVGATYEAHLLSDGRDIEKLPPGVVPGAAGDLQIELEFDPVNSVRPHAGGRYELLPTFTVVDAGSLGSISGGVDPPGLPAEIALYDQLTGALVAAVRAREDGTYTIPRLRAADVSGHPIVYSIEAAAAGYTALEAYTDVVVVPGEDNDGFDFTLVPDSDSSGTKDDKGHQKHDGASHGPKERWPAGT